MCARDAQHFICRHYWNLNDLWIRSGSVEYSDFSSGISEPAGQREIVSEAIPVSRRSIHATRKKWTTFTTSSVPANADQMRKGSHIQTPVGHGRRGATFSAEFVFGQQLVFCRRGKDPHDTGFVDAIDSIVDPHR